MQTSRRPALGHPRAVRRTSVERPARGAARRARRSRSIGVDSWAVDYGLLRDGRLLGKPFHYRDERTAARRRRRCTRVDAVRRALRAQRAAVPAVQHAVPARRRAGASCLDFADIALLIPDLFGFWLTGQARRRAARTRRRRASLASARGELGRRAHRTRSGMPRGRPSRRSSPPASALGAPAARGRGARSARRATSRSSRSARTTRPRPSSPCRCDRMPPPTSRAARGASSASSSSDPVAQRRGARRELHERGRRRRPRAVPAQRHGPVAAQRVGARVGARRATPIDLPTLLDRPRHPSPTPVPVFDANDPRFLAPGDMPAASPRGAPSTAPAPPRTRAEFARSIVESLAQAFADAVHERRPPRRASTCDTIHIVGGGCAQRAALPAHRRPRRGCRCSPARSRRPRSATCSCRRARRASSAGDRSSRCGRSCRPRSRPAGTSRAGSAIGRRSGVREQLQADDDLAEQHERSVVHAQHGISPAGSRSAAPGARGIRSGRIDA